MANGMYDDPFWDEMSGVFVASEADDPVSRRLEDARSTSVRDLTDLARQAKALRLPQTAGARVRFIANLGSVLTYDDCPGDNMEGTVVSVKTGSGPATSQDERVFVMWDDGKFRSILAEHLRQAGGNRKQAQAVRMVVGNFMDLTSFFSPTGRADELVHKATKDLWAVKQDGKQLVIERLFNESGEPLKV